MASAIPWCPVCNLGRSDAVSVAMHNLGVSMHGERSYRHTHITGPLPVDRPAHTDALLDAIRTVRDA
jgi:hypothetical protein